MTSATADLFRNLALAWWPPLLVAALVALPWLLVRGLCWIDRDMTRGVQRIDLDDLIDGDTWALDYLDANRAGFERLLHAVDNFDVDDALALANDHTFDNTLGEIRALPETEKSA